MDKETLRTKVLKMKEDGKSGGEISDWLNHAGIEGPRGKKWTAQKVFNYVHTAKKVTSAATRPYVRRNTESYVKSARALMGHEVGEFASDSNSDILSLLDSTKYSDRQKIEAVKALLR